MTAADHANTLREAVDDALIVFEGTQWERAYRNTLRPALDALQTQAETAEAAQFELRAEWKRAETAEAERDAAVRERDQARDALRFYANEKDYMWHGEQRGTIQKDDRGAVARAALGDTT